MTNLELDLNLDLGARTATDLLTPAPSTRIVNEVYRCRWVHDLVDAWPLQIDALVVHVADMQECKRIMTAVIRLYRELPT